MVYCSLPPDIQWAVCNTKIKIFDDLYTLFWNSGAWWVGSILIATYRDLWLTRTLYRY